MSVFTFGLTGCGGSEDEGASGSETSESTSGQSGSAQPSGGGASFDDVLACLQDEGIDAKDQSSNIGGETIGIDYPGGRTTISFEGSKDDADLTAMLAEDYGEVLQAGSVVATIDPTADSTDSATIESCIAG